MGHRHGNVVAGPCRKNNQSNIATPLLVFAGLQDQQHTLLRVFLCNAYVRSLVTGEPSLTNWR